jgi:hypothetical protein
VYAIAAAGRTADVGGLRLRAIRRSGVAAFVSDVRQAPKATPYQLRRHHRIVAGLAGQLPSILPVRFGTVMDEGELAAILVMRHRSLTTALRHVRGRVQMTLRIPAGEPPVRPPAGRPVPGRQRGRRYLETRAAAAAAERQIPGFDPVRAALGRWVRDERVERIRGVASVYHLVPRASVEAYTRAAQAAMTQHSVRAVLSGPFPPYAFTSW